jgi:MFS family permease
LTRNPTRRLAQIYHEYPHAFWMVVVVNFIDRLGASLLLPFFALYMTKRFSASMETTGSLFFVWTAASFLGSFPSGALTDRMGRKAMIVIGLVATSLANLALGFAKRTQGYGILRVAFNLSAALGPAIGGFIATRSYLGLFIADAAISLAAAALVFLLVPETKPQPQPGNAEESTTESFGGYLRVLKDKAFVLFTVLSTLAWLVYINLTTTLGVFLQRAHGVTEKGYGGLLSLNAALVVLLQFPLTRRLEKRPPMGMLALGVTLIGAGFALYGWGSGYLYFILAVTIITLGEMIALPISNALVVKYSPESMRGRYSFIYSISWGIAYAAGPYLAGVVMDNFDPRWLWWGCGVLAALAAMGFVGMQIRQPKTAAAAKTAPEPLENHQIESL